MNNDLTQFVVGTVFSLNEFYTIESIKDCIVRVAFLSKTNFYISVEIMFGDRYMDDLNYVSITVHKSFNRANREDLKHETINISNLEKSLLITYFNYIES